MIRGSTTPFRVFVSSTVADLQPFREAVRDAVVKCDAVPVMGEDFEASDQRRPLAECVERVRRCDVLVVMVAHRYGWVPEDQEGDHHRSITWLECQAAIDAGLNAFAFLLDSEAEWDRRYTEEYRLTQEPERALEIARDLQQLTAFKSWLNHRGTQSPFRSPEDLALGVTRALNRWRIEREPVASDDTSIGRAMRVTSDTMHYLRWLVDESGFIDIRGLQVGSEKAHSFPIDQLYLPLSARTEPDFATLPGDAGSGVVEKDEIVPMNTALSVGRLVVLGDPGSGKTTFLRQLAHRLGNALLQGTELEVAQEFGLKTIPFPVLIRLSTLDRFIEQSFASGSVKRGELHDGTVFRQFLIHSADTKNWALTSDQVDAILAGPSIFLLDGLDEAASSRGRERMVTLVDCAAASYHNCRFVVTSRPQAYRGRAVLARFERCWIVPLDKDSIDTFLGNWAAFVHRGRASRAQAFRNELLAAIARHPEIERMARTPVMLTALAVVYWNDKRLPDERAELYASIVEWLVRSREEKEGRIDDAACIQLLETVALMLHEHRDGRQTEVRRDWLIERLTPCFSSCEGDATSAARAFVETEELESGIIVRRGERVRFWHLSFQEYLAARALGGHSETDQRKRLLECPERLYADTWQETVLLFAGVLWDQGSSKVDWMINTVLEAAWGRTAEARARALELVGAVLRELPRYSCNLPRLAESTLFLLELCGSKLAAQVPWHLRVRALDTLGAIGDPRFDPSNEEDTWVRIDGHGDVRAFEIGRYPVTVVEFARFVGDGGYTTDDYWPPDFDRGSEPQEWHSQLKYPNRPVVFVSQYEAGAYCQWRGVRLPTSSEWGLAAAGPENRRYPWGSHLDHPDLERANYSFGVRHPTAVGAYPGGVTKDGVADLAGNVWEWCEEPGSSVGVIRGGAYWCGAPLVRVPYFLRPQPEVRREAIGFRVARAVGN